MEAAFSGMLSEGEGQEMLSVLECIRRQRGITLDGICACTSLPYPAAARYAGMLESEGIVAIDLLQRCTINLKNV